LGRFATASAVLAVLLGTMQPARTQSMPPPSLGVQEQAPPQPGPQSSAPPAREENPGLINEMGKLFGKILPPLKSPGETMDDLNTRARDAGDALSRLAKPSAMVTGRIACPASANGAPDCKQAAEKLCQSKGYKEGKSLNADSAETCSPKVLIPGRQRKPDDCHTDTFVTRALCQ
jgi:hypothetical protein